MGRVYLPGRGPRALRGGARSDAGPIDGVMALIAFEAARAEEWYDRGLALLPLLDWRSGPAPPPWPASTAGCWCGSSGTRPPCCAGRMSLPGLGEGGGGRPGPDPRARHEPTARPATGRHVVVVGGGLAGLAAALDCADRGAQVTLLERRNRLGGLTWSFEHDGHWVDNGQHVFLRCCTEYLAFLDRIGAGADVELPGPPRHPGGRPGRRAGRSPRVGRLRRSRPARPRSTCSARCCATPTCRVADRLGSGRAVLALRRLDLDDPALDPRPSAPGWPATASPPPPSPPSGT